VTFTPYLDGMPGQAAHWRWRGADRTDVPDPCAAIVNGTCRYAPATSGRMWGYTAGSGSGDSASAAVTIPPPTLTLTASKTTLPAPGDNDTFTATANGNLVVLGWNFTADTDVTPNSDPAIMAVRWVG
jgi:hypothetical protein